MANVSGQAVSRPSTASETYKLCIVCLSADATKMCVRCKSIKHCSRDCQRVDWYKLSYLRERPLKGIILLTAHRRNHSLVCKLKKDLTPWPSEQYRLDLYFADNAESVSLQWVLCSGEGTFPGQPALQ